MFPVLKNALCSRKRKNKLVLKSGSINVRCAAFGLRSVDTISVPSPIVLMTVVTGVGVGVTDDRVCSKIACSKRTHASRVPQKKQ